MSHHKYRKTKNQRAGCLMCKPNKMNGAKPGDIGPGGFGKIRDDIHTKEDLKDALEHDTKKEG